MSEFDRIPRFADVRPEASVTALEQSAEQSVAARRRLAEVTGAAESPDGTVRAVVGGFGLQELVLDPKAMRKPSQDLAQLIVQVTQQAAEDLAQRRAEQAAELGVPGERPDLEQMLTDLARLRSTMAEGQGDARRVFERFRDQTRG